MESEEGVMGTPKFITSQLEVWVILGLAAGTRSGGLVGPSPKPLGSALTLGVHVTIELIVGHPSGVKESETGYKTCLTHSLSS